MLLSVLGPVGAALEVVLILYLIAASLLGCYSLPLVARIRPRPHDTPMVHVIANCVVVLMLSSALPLLARTLGNDGGIYVCFNGVQYLQKFCFHCHSLLLSCAIYMDIF